MAEHPGHDLDDIDSNSRAIRRLTIGAIIAEVLRILAFALVLFVVVSGLNERTTAEAQRSVDSDYVQCLRGNDSRAGISALIHFAYDNQGAAIDLTHVPGFDAMPPSVQTVFRNIATASAAAPDQAADPNSPENKGLALFEPLDCQARYPTHTPGITSDSGALPTTTTEGTAP